MKILKYSELLKRVANHPEYVAGMEQVSIRNREIVLFVTLDTAWQEEYAIRYIKALRNYIEDKCK